MVKKFCSESGLERTMLAQGARRLDLTLDDETLDQLLGYLALLRKWNRVHNLTAVREPAHMLSQHLLDSLAIVRPLDRVLAGDAPTVNLLDVGSGAGLPGVVLAIVRPRMQITCVDAVEKKAAFVRQVGLELKLSNLAVLHGRVEQLANRGVLPVFNVVTARAFASLQRLVSLTDHLLVNGGCWLAMKAHLSGEETRAIPPNVEVFHVEHLEVPQLHAERCIVWMRRRSRAPDLSQRIVG